MAIWQLCANLLIPNCLRSNLSYSPLAALEFYVKYYKTNYYTSERICCLYKKKGIERHCKSSEALRCNEFSIDKNIINENCDYLSYITYNIWKKGMGNEGIDYIKGKVAQ